MYNTNVVNAYKEAKTCGVIEQDKSAGITKVAEPIGVIAAVAIVVVAVLAVIIAIAVVLTYQTWSEFFRCFAFYKGINLSPQR